ncbi:MAG: hypothetical protein WCT23_05525 [Candidatus Neomarinimicrobiota bacterium]|jgi:hypothetical protein
MPTNLEKAKRNRLRVVEYYENAWEFIIRLLMGLGIYVVLRIILISYLRRFHGISMSFTDSLSELMVLVFSALLMLFFIWLKGSRSHLLAAVFLPVIFCLVLVDSIHFVQLLLLGDSSQALLGYLPFILPLFLILIYWVFDFKALWFRILASLLFLGMSIFWITDIPKSFEEAKNVQSVVEAYQLFSKDLQKDHIVNWEESPEFLQAGNVESIWHSKNVDPAEYRIADDLDEIVGLNYVLGIDIVIPGVKSDLKLSTEELSFKTLQHVGLHYFYKYSNTRKIVIKDFQYTGDSFFLLELENGEKLIVDNVLIRKK